MRENTRAMLERPARQGSVGASPDTAKEMLGRPVPLIVHALFRKRGHQYEGFTLEFGLAVQASSSVDARHKLERIIISYLDDALIGEDRSHAEMLLARRATAKVYALYYYTRLKSFFFRHRDGPHNSSAIPLPFKMGLCST